MQPRDDARRIKWGWIIGFTVAIAVAAALDRHVAQFVREHGIDAWLTQKHRGWLREILKAPGIFYFTVIVAAIVSYLHPRKWRAGLFILLAAIFSGLNYFTKWTVGRVRPFKWEAEDGSRILAPFHFHPFVGGISGSWSAPNLCFPSGHAALAFATATAVSILWPKLRLPLFALASIVAIERVTENAHWLSDVVSAAALGIGSGWIVRRFLWDKIFPEPLESPLIAKHDG